jgi:uncharacterized protein
MLYFEKYFLSKYGGTGVKNSKYNLFIKPNENSQNILYNTFSGFINLVNDKTKEIIKNQEYEKLSKQEYEDLKNKKFIIEDNIDELRILEYNFNKSKFATDDLSITLILTLACNLKCVYCYEGAGIKNSDYMTKEIADRIINYIQLRATNNKSKRINISLHGGEPLLNFEVGKYILNEIKKYCYHTGKRLTTSIITNGVLLTNNILNDLKNYNCNYIQLTLDGTEEVHNKRRMFKNDNGSFYDVITALKLIRDRKDMGSALIRINIDKTNIDSVYKLLHYLKEEDLNTHRLDFGIVHGNTDSCAGFVEHCYTQNLRRLKFVKKINRF